MMKLVSNIIKSHTTFCFNTCAIEKISRLKEEKVTKRADLWVAMRLQGIDNDKCDVYTVH